MTMLSFKQKLFNGCVVFVVVYCFLFGLRERTKLFIVGCYIAVSVTVFY